MQQAEKGFHIRLGRAIDRWSGGGQRAFADALEAYAEQNKVNIPTSYRTIVNYVGGHTTPSRAWVDAAAAVLRWNPEHLWTGEGPERVGGTTDGLRLSVSADAEERTSALLQVLRSSTDLPIGARLMLLRFLDDYFGDALEGWGRYDEGRQQHMEQVSRVLDSFFGALLARPQMRYHETMALTASLTAAAYTQLGANGLRDQTEEENATL